MRFDLPVRTSLVFALALVHAGMCSGCGGEPEVANAASLSLHFPAQASRVLQGAAPFLRHDDGFTLHRSPAAFVQAAVEIALPGEASRPIVLRAPGGFEVQVRELGARGEGTLIEGAVAYRRSGGTSFWTAARGGAEEWLLLDAGVAWAEKPAAVWEVEGAVLRQEGEAVEIADETGRARVLVTAPEAYAVGGRAVSARLDVKGHTIELRVDAAGEEVLVDPAWVVVGSTMADRRRYHVATLLDTPANSDTDGKVLVVGGDDDTQPNGQFSAVAELYDPATMTFGATTPMSKLRWRLVSTALDDGKVLVTGGDFGGLAGSSERFDPVTSTWTSSPMQSTHFYHAIARLADGKVLVAGGFAGGSVELQLAEIYNPVTNSWALATSMLHKRWAHTLTLLPDGKVLAVGGAEGGVPSNTAELYNPMSGAWTSTGAMNAKRYFHSATLLGNGKVLVAGGSPLGPQNAELYDPSNESWSAAGAMAQSRDGHVAALLPSGMVLVAGGGFFDSAELYQPASDAWLPVGPMNEKRYEATGTVLKNGSVLVTGGQPGDKMLALDSAELYTPKPAGAPCGLAGECQSGFCIDAVCCSSACNAGVCDACSVAAGASADGTCSLLTGTACDDGNACSSSDTCQSGLCVGGSPVICTAQDSCHEAGSCNSMIGCPAAVAKPDGAPCDDGNACTQVDSCQGGGCTGSNMVSCLALDACHDVGACDPATGACSHPFMPEGSPCDDGNLCSDLDTCQSGVCVGGHWKVCITLNQCHLAGTCDPQTGVCSDPPRADGAPCDDGNLCTLGDSCEMGECTPGTPVTCPDVDACHIMPGSCIKETGLCSKPFAKSDNSPCPGGVCKGGLCDLDTAGTGSGGAGGGGGQGGEAPMTNTPGCGCTVGASPRSGALWLELGLLVTGWRRRRRMAPCCSSGQNASARRSSCPRCPR